MAKISQDDLNGVLLLAIIDRATRATDNGEGMPDEQTVADVEKLTSLIGNTAKLESLIGEKVDMTPKVKPSPFANRR